MTERRGPWYVDTALKEAGLASYLSSKGAEFSSHSGADIKAVMYLPLLTRGAATNVNAPKIKVFADLQTLSISSTRSISPVRVLGRSDPLTYTRGARTSAGTMVFASISHDPFGEIYDVAMAESYMSSSQSMVSDQLPPFSIVITAANEQGSVGISVIHGITLVNYGTTYSIDDLYTEVQYGYVATNIVPLTTDNMAARKVITNNIVQNFATISSLVENSMDNAYGRMGTLSAAITARYIRQETARQNSEEFSNGGNAGKDRRYHNG